MLTSLTLAACSPRAAAPTAEPAAATVATVALAELPPTSTAPTAPIEIGAGTLVGGSAGGVDAFKGIPYAAPPVGDLRWRAPQRVEPWTGVHQTTAFAHDCMQPEGDVEPIQTTPSEDCLHLNVWRPADAPADAKLPVLFWIHGGGFVGGGTSIPFYDGSAFARQGLVVVSPNYRLGRLGFFAHPALLNSKEGPVGNFGYMDQIAALKWVQDNVAAFGGDPNKVTIIGESAGGASVLAMLTSPVTEGLFHQVMIMSGGGRKPLVGGQMTGGTASASSVDAKFAQSLGIDGDDAAALAALRALPAEDLVKGYDLSAVFGVALSCVGAQLKDPQNYDPNCKPPLAGTQMIDGQIVTGTPEDVIKSGAARYLPTIAGTTAADLPEYFPPDPSNPYAYFGDDAGAARAHYRLPFIASAVLLLKGQSQLRDLLPLASIGSDMTMHEPARFVAREMAAKGQPSWLYRFTYTAESTRPESTKQSHAGELPFMFDMLEAKYGDKVTDNDRAMARRFNTYVANFVKTGNPNGDGLPEWPKFDPTQYNLLDFSLEDGPKYGPDPRADGVRLVERAADTQDR
jgi:para-nitrobenzyl esterase